MKELIQMLQDKRDWLSATQGIETANVSLTLEQLDMILAGTKELLAFMRLVE